MTKAIGRWLTILPFAALALCAARADAGGNIRVVNQTAGNIHPWYRSNCFSDTPPFVSGSTWIFFGNIGAHGSFEWEFTPIMDLSCRRPIVEFAYTTDDGSTPPPAAPPPDMVASIRWSTDAGVTVLDVLADGAVAPLSAVHACEAAKLTTASQEIAGKMKCAAMASQTSKPIDGACLAKAATRADAGYARAGDLCTGRSDAFHTAVDVCTGALNGDAPGNGRCPAASRKALGKGAATAVRCQATEIVDPGTFAVCDTRQAVRTTSGITRAGSCGQASTATIAADVDACRMGLQDVIVPTTTITTSTTTTTLPFCASFLCHNTVTCGPGLGCAPNESGQCICTPTPSCGASDYPTCGGKCPDGRICVPQLIIGTIADFRGCACVPPDLPCSTNAVSCGYGACAAGSVCRISEDFASCSGGCGGP